MITIKNKILMVDSIETSEWQDTISHVESSRSILNSKPTNTNGSNMCENAGRVINFRMLLQNK